jgi:hypothetical protein
MLSKHLHEMMLLLNLNIVHHSNTRSNLIEVNTTTLPLKEEKQLVAAVTTLVQPTVLSSDQWPWYGYVILNTVATTFLI